MNEAKASASPAGPGASTRRMGHTVRVLAWLGLAFALALIADAVARPRHGLEARYHNDFSGGPSEGPFLIRREPNPSSYTFPDMLSKPGKLRVVYRGFVRIKYPGTYHFFVGTRGDKQRTWMSLDGKPLAGTNAGQNFSKWRGTRTLRKGLYPMELEWRGDEDLPPAERVVSLMWGKEIDSLQVIPKYAIVGPEARRWRFALSDALRGFAVVIALAALWLAPGLFLAPRPLRRLRFRLIAIGMSLVFCAVAMELALRIGGYKPRKYVPGDIWLTYKFPDPKSVTRYKGYLAYHVREFETEVRINSSGWRDKEYTPEKPPGVRRALVVGDSYVEGKEVELDQTFHKLLERGLNEKVAPETGASYEVMALGRGGTSTVAHLDYLTSPGLAYHPDVVVLSFFPGNDVRENSMELNEEYQRWLDEVYLPHFVPARIAVIDKLTLAPWSYLNQFFVDRFSDFYVGRLYWFHKDLKKERMVSNDLDVYRDKSGDKRWEDAWGVSEDFIERARDKAEGAGAKFLVMIVFSAQLPGYDSGKLMSGGENGLDLRRPFNRIEEILKRNGIRYVNLQPIMTEHERKTGEKYYWKYDAHWNQTGHRIAADALLKEIEAMERENAQ